MITDIIYNVGILFVMMVPGIILKVTKLSIDGLGKALSNIVLYIAQPALVLRAYLMDFDPDTLTNIIWVFALSVVGQLIFAAVAFLMYRKSKDSVRRMLRFATIFSNAAFMGIPLVEAIFTSINPAMALKATLYATIYNVSFNFFLWTLGVHICTADRDYDGDGTIDKDIERKHKSEASVKKALLNPITLASFVGLIIFFTSAWNYVPQSASGFIVTCLDYLKGLVAPLSMIVLGLRIAELRPKGLFNDFNMYVMLSLRHIILPLVVVGIMKLIVLIGIPLAYEVQVVTLILSATPVATSATMFAEKYDCDSVYVSKLVAISTLLSIATMPIMAALI
jgi:predicted permease